MNVGDLIRVKADWQFTTDNARLKLKRLYPQFERLKPLARESRHAHIDRDVDKHRIDSSLSGAAQEVAKQRSNPASLRGKHHLRQGRRKGLH